MELQLIRMLLFTPILLSTVSSTSSEISVESILPHPRLLTFLEPCSQTLSQVNCDDEDVEDYEADSDECLPVKTDNCDRSLQLYCENNICQANCHPIKEEYDPAVGRCFRKIGSDCKTMEDCDKNAICERGDRRKVKICRCSKAFRYDPLSRKCILAAEYGEACDDSNVICDVISDILCHNNTCECRSPLTQFYHQKSKKCLLRIGEDCRNQGFSRQFCPDNSACMREFPPLNSSDNSNSLEEEIEEHYIGIPEEDDKIFKCKCSRGHAPTANGERCLGLYGMNCDVDHKCNTERFLKCYGGICHCARPKDQEFSGKEQKCFVKAGSICDMDKQEHCIEAAECQADVDTGLSSCQCGNGFMSASDGEVCLKDYGQNCSMDSGLFDGEALCNIFVGLECSNETETCQCKEPNQFYDVRMKVCRDFETVERTPAHDGKIVLDISDREYTFGRSTASDSVKLLYYYTTVFIAFGMGFIILHFLCLNGECIS